MEVSMFLRFVFFIHHWILLKSYDFNYEPNPQKPHFCAKIAALTIPKLKVSYGIAWQSGLLSKNSQRGILFINFSRL
jgi:hypothetical protein